MSVDRELLWKAWPDGYLAARGVSTIGGWRCLSVVLPRDPAEVAKDLEDFVRGNAMEQDESGFIWDSNGYIHSPDAFSEDVAVPTSRWTDDVHACTGSMQLSHVVVSDPDHWVALDDLICEALDRGDLLPNVDPADRATWACLLEDLAEALGDRFERPVAANDAITAYVWKTNCCDGREDSIEMLQWRLEAHTFQGLVWVFHFDYDIDTDDPAEALVRARIQVREGRGAPGSQGTSTSQGPQQ